MHQLTSADLAEHMAFDMLKDEKEVERIKTESRSDEENAQLLKAFFVRKSPNF